MRILVITLALLSSSAFAACETYSYYGKPVAICWKKELRAMMNSKCDKDCLALEFMKKKNPKPPFSKNIGGKNPAAEKCKYYNIKVVVMKDPRGAEQSFCEFPDGSLVDSNALARSLK